MLSKIKKQVKEHTVKKEIERIEKAKKVFGDCRFDFIRKCVHELDADGNPKLCVFCNLIKNTTRQHFQDEADRANESRIISMVNRAQMRYNLLDSWSRNQQSCYADSILGFVAEITFSGNTVIAVSSEKETELPNWSDLKNILKRRRRILEVGDYAATFLQARIRKMISWKKTRPIILNRYELVPATHYRAEFYIDKKTQTKCKGYPAILKNERPASPNTIGRRLNNENVKKEKKLAKYKSLAIGFSENIWLDEEFKVTRARQLSVLRDVVATAMISLTKTKRLQDEAYEILKKAEDENNRILEEKELEKQAIIAAENAKRNPKKKDAKETPEDIAQSIADAEAAQLIIMQEKQIEAAANAYKQKMARREFVPVWFSLSSPAPSSHAIGLSLALETKPPELALIQSSVDTMAIPIVLTSKIKIKGKKNSSPTKRPKSPEVVEAKIETEINPIVSPVNNVSYNSLIQELEQRSWDALICETPEDVVKILLCPELHPALNSGVNFADDEHGIWRGNFIAYDPILVVPIVDDEKTNKNTNKIDERNVKTVAVVKNKEEKEIIIDKKKEHHLDVLPVSLSLRPYYETRKNPMGLFRLYFYDGELLAITPSSVWAYYPEIYANRDAILATIRAYSIKPAFKEMLKSILQKSKDPRLLKGDNVPLTDKEKIAQLMKGDQTPLPKIGESARATGERAGGVLSLYIPPEVELFHKLPYLQPVQLTDEEAVSCHSQYKFLNKLSSWKNIIKRSNNNLKKKKRDTNNNDIPLSSINNIALSENDLMFPKKLAGEDLYKQFCLDIPKAGQAKDVSDHSIKEYENKLKSFLKDININIAARINQAHDPKTGEEIPHPPSNIYDLFSLEVYIDLTKKEKIIPVVVNAEQKKSKADKLKPMEKVVSKLLPIETHQIIGVFSCSNERAPPNLDFGLFDWDFFRSYHTIGRKKRPSPTERPWSTPDPDTGISMHKEPMPKDRGEFVFRIVSECPTPLYLESVIPRKVKTWLGMP